MFVFMCVCVCVCVCSSVHAISTHSIYSVGAKVDTSIPSTVLYEKVLVIQTHQSSDVWSATCAETVEI